MLKITLYSVPYFRNEFKLYLTKLQIVMLIFIKFFPFNLYFFTDNKYLLGNIKMNIIIYILMFRFTQFSLPFHIC